MAQVGGCNLPRFKPTQKLLDVWKIKFFHQKKLKIF